MRHLHVVFVDGGMEDRAASPSEHDGLEDGQIGGFVEADDGDERVGLLVHAEHAAGIVDEGRRHLIRAGLVAWQYLVEMRLITFINVARQRAAARWSRSTSPRCKSGREREERERRRRGGHEVVDPLKGEKQY